MLRRNTMLRVFLNLTLLSVSANALGCGLILRDLPPKEEIDAGSTPPDHDAGKVGDVDADAHVEEHLGHDGGGMNDGAAAEPDAAQEHDSGPDLPPVDPDGCDGGPEKVFFRDDDEDGYGTSESAVAACEKPSDGHEWVELGDDCNDDEPDVHPGQTEFFGVGYQPSGQSGGLRSFDYDCNGSETAGPNQPQAPASCAGLLTCAGGGYVPNDERTGVAGINAYCGSNVISTCNSAGLACQASPSTNEQPYLCR